MENQPYDDDTKLDFKHHLEFKSSEEMNNMFADDNQSLSNLIVDIALENLDTTVKTIPVVSIVTLEDDLVYDVVIDRIDMVETLEQNLGENGAEAHFKWEPKSGCFIPHEQINLAGEKMPWE